MVLGVALLALSGAACAPAPEPAADPAVLMQADRDFAADVAEGGADAWARWFAPDGAMIQEGTGEIRGRDAIREAVAYLDRPSPVLTWEPTRADIAASGDLGWTTGTWEVRTSPDAEPTSRGLYVSIWRKQPDGSWKVVMDLGNNLDEG
jgi:ketosteroid isomerase-like protein